MQEKNSNNNVSDKKTKNNLFYIITISILAIIYIFWFWQINFCTINVHIKSSIIISIPIMFIFIMYYLTKKGKIREKIGKLISIFLIIIFFVLNFFIIIFVMVDEGTSYEDNPLNYEHICNIAGYNNIRFQFPDKIPQDLIKNNKVKFLYRPQFLQGGFCFELLLEMENDDINEYIKKHETEVKEIVEVDEKNIDSLYGKYGIHTPSFLEYEEGKDFFLGSQIYILGYESYKPNDWNHGYVYYIAKNDKEKKLLLVTEIW